MTTVYICTKSHDGKKVVTRHELWSDVNHFLKARMKDQAQLDKPGIVFEVDAKTYRDVNWRRKR